MFKLEAFRALKATNLEVFRAINASKLQVLMLLIFCIHKCEIGQKVLGYKIALPERTSMFSTCMYYLVTFRAKSVLYSYGVGGKNILMCVLSTRGTHPFIFGVIFLLRFSSFLMLSWILGLSSVLDSSSFLGSSSVMNLPSFLVLSLFSGSCSF